jgi:hypothetical protein
MVKSSYYKGFLNYPEFFISRIKDLRDIDISKGIHIPYSGFNEDFKKYYSRYYTKCDDPRVVADDLERRKIIETRPARGGAMMYIYGEAPRADPFPRDPIKLRDRERVSGLILPSSFSCDRPDACCRVDGGMCDEGFGIHNLGEDSEIKSCRFGKWNHNEDDPPCNKMIERKKKRIKPKPKRKPVKKCRCK